MMRKLMNVLVVTLVAGPALVLGQAGDVHKVLADMRAALGGADKVAAVKTLTAVGRTQRTSPNGTASEAEMELAMELPDKYVARTVLANMGSMSVYRNAGFNGNGVINETEMPPNLTGGGMIMVRSAGSGAPGQAQSPEQKAASDARLLAASKKDFARMTVGMFGSSFEAFPLEFAYGGQAESPDGKAHVITVTGADNFAAKLFVDAQTNLPLMLSWSDKEPLMMTQTINRGGGPGAAPAGGGHTVQMGGGASFSTGTGGKPPTDEEMKKMMADAEARRKEAEAALKVVEYRIYYSNFKAVNGVKLPHTLQRSIDGKPTEETTFEQIKVNPKIDKQKFVVSK